QRTEHVRDRPVREVLAMLREVVERMAGQIEPEAFALRLKTLPFRPLAHDWKLVLERLARIVAEQGRLSARERMRGMLREAQRVRNRLHQGRAVRTETVERAAARERLEHAPVQLLAVDPAAKIEQILVLAVRLPLRDDRLRGAAADALDRAEPVADPPRTER